MNQIRGHDISRMFGLVEEFILPFAVDHAREQLERRRLSAFAHCSSSPAKRPSIFICSNSSARSLTEALAADANSSGPPRTSKISFCRTALWASASRSCTSSGSLCATISIACTTIRTDPQFKSLLKHHWLEESQHSKIDTLIVEEMAASASDAEIDRAFEEYGKIGAFLDKGIKQQTEFNVDAFEQCRGQQAVNKRARSR